MRAAHQSHPGILALSLTNLVLFAVSTRADVINVPADFPTIQEAIDAASDGDEVVIADGVYSGQGNQDIDFGGRLIKVRSANGPETCVIDCTSRGRGFWFHSGETRAATLEGVTVANCELLAGGGGILVESSSPTIANCLFFNNAARPPGGGGARIESGSPLFVGCTFEGNELPPMKNYGAGISSSGTPSFYDCYFLGNISASDGGGAYSDGESIEFVSCRFEGNYAERQGGGIYASNCTVRDCVFISHFGPGSGAHIYHWEGDLTISDTIFGVSQGGGLLHHDGTLTIANSKFHNNLNGAISVGFGVFDITNSVFWLNSGRRPSAIDNISAMATVKNCSFSSNRDSTVEGPISMVNCIVWGNDPDPIRGDVAITYSDIQGGWPGVGNINVDPLFAGGAGPDVHLLSGSPAIDAGNNLAVNVREDLDGNPRLVDDWESENTGNGICPIVDMGAHEFQAEGGCCVRDPQWLCDGDVDGDGQVNPVDSGLVQAAFGLLDEQELCNYDMDCDGMINPVDVGIVLSLFGTCDSVRDVCE